MKQFKVDFWNTGIWHILPTVLLMHPLSPQKTHVIIGFSFLLWQLDLELKY